MQFEIMFTEPNELFRTLASPGVGDIRVRAHEPRGNESRQIQMSISRVPAPTSGRRVLVRVQHAKYDLTSSREMIILPFFMPFN